MISKNAAPGSQGESKLKRWPGADFFFVLRVGELKLMGLKIQILVHKIQLLKFMWAFCSQWISLIYLYVSQQCDINRYKETVFFSFLFSFLIFDSELYIQLYMNLNTLTLQNQSLFFLLYPQKLVVLRGATEATFHSIEEYFAARINKINFQKQVFLQCSLFFCNEN